MYAVYKLPLLQSYVFVTGKWLNRSEMESNDERYGHVEPPFCRYPIRP